MCLSAIFFIILLFLQKEREREREREKKKRERERVRQAMCNFSLAIKMKCLSSATFERKLHKNANKKKQCLSFHANILKV